MDKSGGGATRRQPGAAWSEGQSQVLGDFPSGSPSRDRDTRAAPPARGTPRRRAPALASHPWSVPLGGPSLSERNGAGKLSESQPWLVQHSGGDAESEAGWDGPTDGAHSRFTSEWEGEGEGEEEGDAFLATASAASDWLPASLATAQAVPQPGGGGARKVAPASTNGAYSSLPRLGAGGAAPAAQEAPAPPPPYRAQGTLSVSLEPFAPVTSSGDPSAPPDGAALLPLASTPGSAGRNKERWEAHEAQEASPPPSLPY